MQFNCQIKLSLCQALNNYNSIVLINDFDISYYFSFSINNLQRLRLGCFRISLRLDQVVIGIYYCVYQNLRTTPCLAISAKYHSNLSLLPERILENSQQHMSNLILLVELWLFFYFLGLLNLLSYEPKIERYCSNSLKVLKDIIIGT